MTARQTSGCNGPGRHAEERQRARGPRGAGQVQDLRNQAVAACAHEWIFSLDSDVRWAEAVRDEILALIAGSFLLPGFWTLDFLNLVQS